MNLDFLSVPLPAPGEPPGAATPIARSPMERSAAHEGARFELRDGWNVAAGYDAGLKRELEAATDTAAWADCSHLRKLELQAPAPALSAIAAACTNGAELELGTAIRAGGAWWCPLTRTRALVVGEPAAVALLSERLGQAVSSAPGAGVVEVTTTFAALTLTGPLAREVLARFSALDLRPRLTPVGALRPGSIARQPAILVCESENRYLFMFGWATAEYMWSVVSDAGHHLGGRPIGADALAALPMAGDRLEPAPEASRA